MTASLSFEDTIQVLERLDGENGLVLIGGQALNYWCDRYKVGVPELQDHGPFTSKDVDLQGDRGMASRCAALLGGQYVSYNRRDAPLMLGVVNYTNANGVEHAIDFLASAAGLKPDEIFNFSIPVEVDCVNGKALEFRVMHPVHCLESRVYNVVELASKYSTEHGIRQLKASILCAREFIRELSAYDARAACNLNERVFRFASDGYATRLHTLHGVEVFDAVACVDALPEKFQTIRYPQMQAQVSLKRVKRSVP